MSTKTKRDEPQEKKPRKKKSDDDDNDEEGDGVEEEIDEGPPKVVLEEFLGEYKRDQATNANDVNEFVTNRVFDSYLTVAPLDNVYYSKKTLFPEMMLRLRRIVEERVERSDEWNFTFTLKKDKPVLSFNSAVTFNPRLSISGRLIADPNTIVFFTLTDLACLHAALKHQNSTLVAVRGRKTEAKSLVPVENLVARLNLIRENLIGVLRASPGTVEWLRGCNLMYKGQPLFFMVEVMSANVRAFANANTTGGIVAIYYDFENAELSTVKAEHIEVPSVAQLDAAYQTMRQHPTRVILLDMREHYKSLRTVW